MMYLDQINKSLLQKYKATDFDLDRLLEDSPTIFSIDEEDTL
jgi:hypothetical protein